MRPAVNLEISVSPATADWLERKAEAAGANEAEIAARLLDDAARRDLRQNADFASLSPPDWIREFDRWTQSLRGRGGRADTHTDTLYD